MRPGRASRRAHGREQQLAQVVLVAQEVVGHHDDERARRAAPASLVGTLEHETRGSRESLVRQEPRSVVDDDRTPAQVRGGGHEWRGVVTRAAIRRRSGGSSTSTNARTPSASARTWSARPRRSSAPVSAAAWSATGRPTSPASSRPAAPAAGPARRRGAGLEDRHHADAPPRAPCGARRRPPPPCPRARRTARSPRCTPDPNPRPSSSSAVRSNETTRAWPSVITILATSATSFSRHPPLMLPIGAPSSGTSSRAPGAGRWTRAPRRPWRARASRRAPRATRSRRARP